MKIVLTVAVMWCVALTGWAKEYQRIVSVDGFITETVCALGLGDKLVGVGQTSIHPVDVVKGLPKVGYIRQLNAEGLLSLNPDIILVSDKVKPPVVVEQIRQAGVEIRLIPANSVSTEMIFNRIQAIGDALSVSDKAALLIKQSKATMTALQRKLEHVEQPGALFFLSLGGGNPLTAGRGTNPDWMFKHAKAKNLADFDGWKNLSAESAVALQPDVIFIMGSHQGRPQDPKKLIDGVKALPGIATSPAAKHSRVFVVDYAYTFSLGSRVSKALWEVASYIHPDAVPKTAVK